MEEDKFREILARYTAGDATEEERAWLESAYINWNSKELLPQSASFLEEGTNEIWNDLLRKTRPVRRINRLRPLIAAAALVVISLSAVYIYQQIHPKSYLTDLPASADLKPGKDRAILVLANGTRVNLDQTGSGHVADQTGVSISKTSDGQIVYSVPEEKIAAAAIQYNTVVTPAGGQYQVNLPDGTKVWLNAASSLTFPTSFATVRTVKLSGEAYFEVSKISEEGRRIPFVVESANQKVEVLGTHFDVNAYADEPGTRTTLLEGSVRINDAVLLKPGQRAQIQGEVVKVREVNAEDDIDWQKGDFILEHNDFRATMRKIARWYDVDVVYSEDAPEKLKLGGWISRSQNISSILQVMEKTGKIHFKIEGRRITVSR